MIKSVIRENSLYKLGLMGKPEILDFMDSKLKDLKQFKDNEYINFIMWGKSKNDIYIEQDLENDYFYIIYDKMWAVLKSDFGLNYNDIQSLTEWYIETTYNLKGVTNRNYV